MMKKILVAFLFCLLFTGGISFGDGYMIKKSVVAGVEGTEFAIVPLTVCSPDVTCSGTGVVDVDENGQFELCWTAESNQCESGPLSAQGLAEGSHYFTIQGFIDDREVTYDRWDETTNSYVPTTYTLPGSTTPDSNEAVLIVVGPATMPPPPSRPGSCSISRIIP